MDPQNCPIRTAVPSLGFLAATGPRRIYSRLAGSGLGLAADDDRSGRTVANTGEQPSWFFPAAGAPERADRLVVLSVILTPVEEYVDGRRLLI
ncbi:hypothetical protein DTO164E3_3303 [Paecilomyces variotii]|nr:hypothetical protein DTO164E3_3303 [Paecilomyces variotii]KAJ9411140.1 hypothetical protein DTO045G8_772 [Paecilomyces variotii]